MSTTTIIFQVVLRG